MIPGWEIMALGTGVVTSAIGGGTFFAFSNFVMPALSKVAAPSGIASMQAINRAAPSPGFVTALLTSVLAGIPVVVAERSDLASLPTRLSLVGAVLGGVSLAITLGRNVPQNDELESFDADSDAAAAYWDRYLEVWTRDNTLRGIASLASATAYAGAMVGR